jgi:hypothetical protein
MRYVIDVGSSMDDSLLEMYGGSLNLILAIAGSIVVVSICIYCLNREFIKMKGITHPTNDVTVNC